MKVAPELDILPLEAASQSWLVFRNLYQACELDLLAAYGEAPVDELARQRDRRRRLARRRRGR